MFRALSLGIFFLSFAIVAAAHSEEHIKIDADSQERSVCGLHLAKIPGVVLEASKIDSDSLHSRVDNERYAACPYQIFIRYRGQKLRVDFSKAFTLLSVRNYDGTVDINSGYFIYDESGWHVIDESIEPSSSRINVSETADSQTIVGTYVRRAVSTDQPEFCLGLTAVGNRGFATAGTCSTDRSVIAGIGSLVTGAVPLWFEK